MEIENIPISEIIPYKDNPRKNERAINVVAKSIKEFGFRVPIIIDKNNIIVTGHTRLLAAKKLELKEVPIIWADDLTEEQIKAYRIMDNKSAEYSFWDNNLLKQELMALQDLDFDMDKTGFTSEEISKVIKGLDFGTDKDLEGLEDMNDSQIRMVQLFFNLPQHTEFIKMINEIGVKFQTKSITDTIWRIVNEIYKTKIQDE